MCLAIHLSFSEADLQGILQPLDMGSVCLGHAEGWRVWRQAGIKRLITIGQVGISLYTDAKVPLKEKLHPLPLFFPLLF